LNGVIKWIQLDQGADDHDHLISPEERLNLAMAGSKRSPA
jgi:arylsulfatase